MKDYIISSELGRLCKTNEVLTDREGRKRKGLIYWSDFSNDRVMKFFYVFAFLQYILIKILASDIKEVKIINKLKEEIK